jgi:hypothetical protein
LGGSVSVQSKEGAGSSFNINFNTKCNVVNMPDNKNLRYDNIDSCNFRNDEEVPDYLANDPNSHIFILKKNNEKKFQNSLDIKKLNE